MSFVESSHKSLQMVEFPPGGKSQCPTLRPIKSQLHVREVLKKGYRNVCRGRWVYDATFSTQTVPKHNFISFFIDTASLSQAGLHTQNHNGEP